MIIKYLLVLCMLALVGCEYVDLEDCRELARNYLHMSAPLCKGALVERDKWGCNCINQVITNTSTWRDPFTEITFKMNKSLLK